MAVSESSSLRFARTVQALSAVARARQLTVPGFRSPPRLVGVQRSIKRGPGAPTVAVVLRGRPWAAVQADMIEGVVVANALASPAADRAREALWEALVPAEGGQSVPARARSRRPTRAAAVPARAEPAAAPTPSPATATGGAEAA